MLIGTEDFFEGLDDICGCGSVVDGINTIWRCPEFNLLKCHSVSASCSSVRMIYIKHGHLECPGCLICVDPIDFSSWFANSKKRPQINSKRKKKLLRRKLKSKKRKIRRSKYKANQSVNHSEFD
ncbi:hypothetical protein CAPTEDRAFT_227937 [Capitella teleta]|uniref:Uncharacterized protein n=1 Tax=Capitella teleta TaxID=283909 RepID=R7TKN5_CAPTE|nr:hypothetical protein CAPTEDRAFT_227937 [Capitella teleta]|eukprot:ELT94067.1 hypothetical protein CAPTEDRAFT_227937 [Capitella teleta]